MTYEIGRRLIDGVWTTDAMDESGGGGGTGLPTGWTQDASNPANVDSNGGGLNLSGGALTVNVATAVVYAIAGANTEIRSGAAAPTTGLGVGGEPGSLYLRTNGQLWVKTGAGDTDWEQIGGIPAGAIRIETCEVAFDDFTYVLGVGLTTAPVYTLQPGEQLLRTTGRVTELFNDTNAGPVFLTDAANTANIGLATGTIGPDVPAATAGLVSVDGTPIGDPGPVEAFVTPETAAVPLHLVTGAADPADGTTGMVTVWLYIGTP